MESWEEPIKNSLVSITIMDGPKLMHPLRTENRRHKTQKGTQLCYDGFQEISEKEIVSYIN